MSAPRRHAPVLLGIDFGTESCRVAVFDPDGRPVSFASTAYATSFGSPGWAEQDPDDWYRALIRSTREAVERAVIDPAAIAGIGYAATSATVVALDANWRPVRPALLWMDVRAADQVARVPKILAAMAEPGRARNVPASAELFPFKVAWLKENEPESYHRAAHLLDAPDWLGLRLTGQLRINENSAAVKMYHDRSRGGFPEDFYAGLGCADVLAKLPDSVQPPATTLGNLSASAAADLGLRPGTPVAQGCIDAYAGQIGLGVLRPGPMALITGSSHVLLGQAPLRLADTDLACVFADALIPGQCSVEAAVVSSGSALRWFQDNFAPELRTVAATGGPSVYEQLNDAARGIPPGSEGLVVVPSFQGTRAPEADSRARAVIWGLALSHTRAHVYHALQESICYALAHNLQHLAAHGYLAEHLIACGGATHSAQWMQMHADVTGLPVLLTQVQDAVSLGACIMAATAGGVYPSLVEAAAAMVHESRQFEPDAERHEAYAPFVKAHIGTYPRLRELQHDLAAHLGSVPR